MLRGFLHLSRRRGWRAVILVGLATFAASFGVLSVFAAGWVGAAVSALPQSALAGLPRQSLASYLLPPAVHS